MVDDVFQARKGTSVLKGQLAIGVPPVKLETMDSQAQRGRSEQMDPKVRP